MDIFGVVVCLKPCKNTIKRIFEIFFKLLNYFLAME